MAFHTIKAEVQIYRSQLKVRPTVLDNLSRSLQWEDITDHSLGIGCQIGCSQEKAAWEPVVKGIPPVAHGWLRKRHHKNYLGLLAAFSGPAGLLLTGG